ncbi:MAG: ABC transporter permease subunit [Chloroflexi bacterium]|mgnify:CR=1 FL=1|nr:ABC transporter permease subunit [Chloroflexota bacterium]MBT7080744.1 ABC transporter permease subunit [Chloroflexota bacterium]MBT7290439.1 ABC transporter permease subunit [Chloroflexota bacterium]
MFEMMKVEMTKLRKRRMTWILLGCMVGVYVLIYVIHIGLVNNPPASMPQDAVDEMKASVVFPDSLNLIFGLAQSFGTLLLVIMIGAGVGSEYGWGSVRQVLTRKGIRHEYILSKFFAYIVYAVIGLVISVAVGFVMSMITTASIEGSINWAVIDREVIGTVFRNFGWTLYSLIPYILLAITFAILGRSALVGIGASLGYVFLELFAGPLLNLGNASVAKISHFLIGTNTAALLPQSGMESEMSMIDPPTMAWAAITLAIYSLVFLGISLWLFKKRDLTA